MERINQNSNSYYNLTETDYFPYKYSEAQLNSYSYKVLSEIYTAKFDTVRIGIEGDSEILEEVIQKILKDQIDYPIIIQNENIGRGWNNFSIEDFEVVKNEIKL
jgi:hypothetical protein